jgi:site-specific recombinase XerD
MSGKRIGLKVVRALGPGETVWDSAVPSFGARREKGATVAYVLKFRTAEGRQRWHTIGRHGAPWTPDTARDEPRRLLGEVVSGGDPSGEKISKRTALTVAQLCDRYFEDAMAGRVRTRSKAAKKASTLTIDRGRIERHIKPLMGTMGVAVVTRHDVERFLHDIADGRTAGKTKTKARGLARVTGGETAANRSVGLLGAIFTYAVRKDLRSDNPVRGVALFADRKRERRLPDEEFAKFGEALREAEKTIWPPAVAAARFIALTGFRRGEAISLRWGDIDLGRRTATLADTKTGLSIRPLSRAACDILRGLRVPSFEG